MDQALRSHYETLTQEVRTPQHILDYAEEVGTAWANKYLESIPFGPFDFPRTPGACFEHTRR